MALPPRSREASKRRIFIVEFRENVEFWATLNFGGFELFRRLPFAVRCLLSTAEPFVRSFVVKEVKLSFVVRCSNLLHTFVEGTPSWDGIRTCEGRICCLVRWEEVGVGSRWQDTREGNMCGTPACHVLCGIQVYPRMSPCNAERHMIRAQGLIRSIGLTRVNIHQNEDCGVGHIWTLCREVPN